MAGIEKVDFYQIRDDRALTVETLREALAGSDLVIFSGGISVGEYDFVKPALEEMGVREVFYKVAQKPGKPLYFGVFDDQESGSHKTIFALPGNPASALVCFYEYVYPAIRIMMGFEDIELSKRELTLTAPIAKKADRANFIRAKVTGEEVVSLEGQESFILKSFALANALIYLPTSIEKVEAGEKVEVHMLPE